MGAGADSGANPGADGSDNVAATGAAAPQGGWFAEALLGAMAKYEQAKALRAGELAQQQPAKADADRTDVSC